MASDVFFDVLILQELVNEEDDLSHIYNIPGATAYMSFQYLFPRRRKQNKPWWQNTQIPNLGLV
jgi:hypothetical protein